MNIIIKTTYKGNQILFYEGKTNKSGLIEKIELPAPKIVLDNLVVPEQIIYEVVANYPQEDFTATYKVNMYEDICVVQNINVPPRTLEVGAMWQ